MSRLPTPGSDDGNWGEILNDFLEQSHNSDGSLKSSAIPTIAASDVTTSDSSTVQSKLTDHASQLAAIKNLTDGEQPVEIFTEHGTFSDKVSGGITYTWNVDKTRMTAAGTRTGTSFNNMAGGTATFPYGMVAGESYSIKYSTTNTNLVFVFLLYVDGVNTYMKSFTSDEEYQIPSNTTGLQIRFMVIGTGAVVNDTVDLPEIYTIPAVLGADARITALENAVNGSATNPLASIKTDGGMLSCFLHVGCVGDSLSSGESAYHESGGAIGYHDVYEHSWGQYLARMTGNTYYNFSSGGLSTQTWLSSQYATQAFDGNHDCEAYFIALGQNDANASIPVGTASDINISDYTQNADTYYGNYGRIIQMIQDNTPKAKIFLLIDPNPPSGVQTYNDAVYAIAAMFDNVYLIDLKTYAQDRFQSGFIKEQERGGHYSAIAYKQIACIIATYVDWIIRNNPDEFSQIEFINTEYAW